ncbi:MAG: septum site-determining protein MinC [Chloroflexi bacterium]|nr:septum site-determining protein MinC [Anaerolineaceae bacterium]NMB90297.1 septum site-determining protein MinC [Chloroflexota bacterium]
MVENTQLTVQIKGVRDGLVIALSEASWPDQQAALLTHINERAAFFKGARIALDVGTQILHAAELGALRDRLSDYGITLWAVLSSSPTTEQTAQTLGMATRLSVPRPERNIRPLDTNLPGEAAVMVARTLRSGFRVAYEGHIVVLGDVNPGAEIVAGGSIIVWGKLRGSVQAGSEGNPDATICALEMNPTQIRIADIIGNLRPRRGKPQPEIARIIDGQVVTEIWNKK